MKQIVDELTGEIVDVEETNEIVEKKLYEVGAVDKETFELIETYLYYEDQYKLFKYQLEKAMRENNIKKWDNDYFSATVKEDNIRKIVDTDRLKEDGLYEKYLKLSNAKGGLQIRFKKGK